MLVKLDVIQTKRKIWEKKLKTHPSEKHKTQAAKETAPEGGAGRSNVYASPRSGLLPPWLPCLRGIQTRPTGCSSVFPSISNPPLTFFPFPLLFFPSFSSFLQFSHWTLFLSALSLLPFPPFLFPSFSPLTSLLLYLSSSFLSLLYCFLYICLLFFLFLILIPVSRSIPLSPSIVLVLCS